MSEWKTYKLGSLCKTIFSGGTPATAEPSYWNGDLLWLSSGETRNKYITSTEKYITQEGVDNSSTRLAQKHDIVMACAGQGNTRGQTSIILDDMYINQSVIAIRTKSDKLDYRFLFYDLTMRYDELRAISDASSTRGSITTEMLKKISISMPTLPTQTRIAEILSAYDDAIENNNRRIALLEKAARELYKEWFVRFRFPGHESVKFVNGLPEGWALVRLSELYDTTSGGTPPRQYHEYYQNGVYPWIKTGELNNRFIIETEEKITAEAIKKSSAKVIADGSLIMAMYGATIGQLGFTVGETTCNQACCVFIPKTTYYSKEYLFLWISYNLKHIVGLGFGAAQQNLSQELIAKLNVLKPKANIVQKFTDMVFNKYALIQRLQSQSQNLARQRDLLLPRLMSGRLEV